MKCHKGFEGCSLENGYCPRLQVCPRYIFGNKATEGTLLPVPIAASWRWGYVFDIAPEYLSGMGMCFRKRAFEGKKIRGLPYTYLTASSHWLYNSWGKAGKMGRILAIHDHFLCFCFLILIVYLPIFVFCPQIRMMLQNDHWIQPTFFPSGRIIWTKKHTKTWPKKATAWHPEKGIGMKQTADRFHQVPWTVFVNSFAPRSSRRAPRSEKSMRWTVSTACVFRMMDVEAMQQLDVK